MPAITELVLAPIGREVSSGDARVRKHGRRIHIFGASGAGTTTLGRALSLRLDARHLDAGHIDGQPRRHSS